ncbi:MAG: HAD family phosphatase [Lachnospiraceae bacterium]|jgi:HAD superfamily hydrolase (TIGR01509 family)|nr:HAD family phosphatase [Lachnospiraceae bacterium]GFI17743.1 phosphorylated carbohydrates phosphatase [Lachnospiraceae bacterium]
MIHTIVFDMDGVLINTEALLLKIWKEVAKENDIKDIESTLKLCIGITNNETEAVFARIYGKDFPYQKYKAAASEMYCAQIQKDGLPVKPGVYELFGFLKENGWQIGLASSTREAVVRSEMESIGLLDYFHVVVCGDMVPRSKPNPDIYLKACELLNVSPGCCYAVEDSPNGIRAASEAGMKSIMVPDLIEPDLELQKLFYKKFASLLEVLEFLRKA